MERRGLITLLGTGGSAGVPVISCHCPTCSSLSPYNKRLRPSALMQIANKNLLLDAGPDVRAQLLREKIDHIDGLMITHPHYDHVGGLDELRVFFFKNESPLPCLLSEATLRDVQERYSYLFKKKSTNYTARFEFQPIPLGAASVKFLGLDVQPLLFYQGGMEVTGYRIGNLAYVCDIREYDPSLFDHLEGIEILILSALRQTPSHVHFSIEEAIAFASKTKAKKTYFTHIAHEIEHEKTALLLPEGVFLGFDGLQVEFTA